MPEHRALNAILAPGGITPLYQPIVDILGEPSIVGFECLSRGPRGTNLESAKVLFDYVRLKREETLVDRACVAAALSEAPRAAGLRLNLNVHASTLGRDADFVDFLRHTAKTHGIELPLLTVEIVEHAPPWNSLGFSKALARLRDLGVRIALDDVGLGQSNFKMILDVAPDYLKIDRYFVEDCESDENRKAVIGAVTSLARHFHAVVVAEGVEREETCEALRHIGVGQVQGYLFGMNLASGEASEYADQFATTNRPRP